MAMPTDSIAFHARLSPQQFAARDLVLGLEWTYAELDALVGRLAALLRRRGCVDGERLAVLARNSVGQVALHFACGRVGAIYVPLNWRLSASELDALLQRAAPCVLLGDDVAAARTDMDALADFIASADALEPADTPSIPPDRVSLILFTSGTSGQPKGVMLSEQNLQHAAHNFGVTTRVDARSSFLCEAPMFHIIGLVTNVRSALAVGGSIQVSNGFEPQRSLGWLADPSLGITHYVGVPQMMQAFRNQPGFDAAALRHLTALVSGGAPHASDDLLGWLDDGIPMVCGFGMSEAGTVFGMSVNCDVIRNKLGAAGIATPSVQTRVVDDKGNDCPAGVPGELLLRGPNPQPRLLARPAGKRRGARWAGLVPHRRYRAARRRRLLLGRRPQEGHVHFRRRERVSGRDRSIARRPSGHPRVRGGRPGRPAMGRGGLPGDRAGRCGTGPGGDPQLSDHPAGQVQGAQASALGGRTAADGNRQIAESALEGHLGQ
ncbi:putative o-succinylbenzoate--CoA ligase [Xanthomonas citri pv. fuscans]|nr:putative o-succinylbenzoate--CoA ligase [Xanthomonas citri pv. fuscans]SOO01185.1 putative o-succinylbenzoate--CoA ligase [Xanthomonas citri pv. fuscans]SOO01353.1 putative o-succinylbenzoate--CoA ligase [Xanthomonas citri pv. fuscans]SOO10860.1 putative o-succinylbenzoate--CoA ligase [Xanthomonas citri pv. fuscans]SOO14268.1 putative o-succinylbenzoate--CoA ligase [Xanthomonas citri pv. fuscans]